MKLILAVIISSCCATLAYADEPCGNAVDEADSMNVNKTGCDYSNEGLNGALHKAFNKGNEGAVLETSAEAPVTAGTQAAAITAVQANNVVAAPQVSLLQTEVDQWASIALARTQLLPKAMEKCPKGFSVVRENYRPLAMGRISLSIEFSCLK